MRRRFLGPLPTKVFCIDKHLIIPSSHSLRFCSNCMKMREITQRDTCDRLSITLIVRLRYDELVQFPLSLEGAPLETELPQTVHEALLPLPLVVRAVLPVDLTMPIPSVVVELSLVKVAV